MSNDQMNDSHPSDPWGVWIQGSGAEGDWYTFVDGTQRRPTQHHAESVAINLNESRVPGVPWTAIAKPHPLPEPGTNDALGMCEYVFGLPCRQPALGTLRVCYDHAVRDSDGRPANPTNLPGRREAKTSPIDELAAVHAWIERSIAFWAEPGRLTESEAKIATGVLQGLLRELKDGDHLVDGVVGELRALAAGAGIRALAGAKVIEYAAARSIHGVVEGGEYFVTVGVEIAGRQDGPEHKAAVAALRDLCLGRVGTR